MMIEGGANGAKVGVSPTNRMYTTAEVFLPEEVGALTTSPPCAFAWNSLQQTLTTAGESGILYIQNTDQDQQLLIRSIEIGIGQSTGGATSNAIAKLYGNPSALTGTLVSAGTAVNGVARNVGQAQLANAIGWAGTEGKTITNGTVLETQLLRTQAWQSIAGKGLVLPQSGAIAVSITPPASNTSLIVTVVVTGVFLTNTEAVA